MIHILLELSLKSLEPTISFACRLLLAASAFLDVACAHRSRHGSVIDFGGGVDALV
jgi:hypothetical protein